MEYEKQKIYINTLDLDNIDKQQLKNILDKIQKKSCCLGILYKDSNSKGYHVTITCFKSDCDLCRFVFDDQKRYEIDLGRDRKFQNTLFTEKEYFKGKLPKKKKLHFCEET